MSKERLASRPKRTPLGARNRLTFDKQDPNYVYRVINDQDDRLQRAQEAGYDFVVSDEQLGDKRAAEGGKIDSRVSKPVGNGVRGFLMRIPREYYAEDQQAKAERINATEASMSPNAAKGEYGSGLTND